MSLHIGIIPAGFWDSAQLRAARPEVVYFGQMPQRSGERYQTAHLVPPNYFGGKSAFVYLLMERDGSVIYAGKAREPGQRFDKHRRKEWWDSVALLLLIRVTGESFEDADTLAFHVEKLAIRQLDPACNVAGVQRRRPGIPRGEYA